MSNISIMMRFSVASLALASADMTWEEWKFQYGVAYNSDDEDVTRKQVFEGNLQKINEHNQRNETWTMAMNAFGAHTHEEFWAMVSSNRTGTKPDRDSPRHQVSDSVPASKDWVDEGVFNPVRHQQNSDCWAHSAVGVLESNWAIATGTLPMLTEQQLCDCSNYGTCSGGGDEDGALKWFHKHPACSRDSYKYTGNDGHCKESSCDAAIPKGAVTGTTVVDASAKALKSALAGRPVTASVYGKALGQFYSSGVITSSKGSHHGGVVDTGCKGDVNHAVIAVGYGTDNGEGYFKLRNSWGKSWGEHGYVRLADESSSKYGSACLFEYYSSYPNLDGSAPPGPSPRPSPSPHPHPSPTPAPDPYYSYYYSYYYYSFTALASPSRNGNMGTMGMMGMGKGSMGKGMMGKGMRGMMGMGPDPLSAEEVVV